jgi:DNA-directed RNA polymerase specialized sigma24 family protein
MKRNELDNLLNSIIPKLYSFAYAMIQDDEQAEQLIVDAYSVFLVKEKNFIIDFKYNDNKKEKLSFKNYLLINLIGEIYGLGVKRNSEQKHLKRLDHGEFDSFYKLDVTQRSVLFLKENLKFSIELIQETLQIKKHQVLEQLYNSRHRIIETETTDNYGTF